MLARNWLEDFFEVNGEVMPNPSGGQQVWNLPANTRRRDVFRLYQAWCGLVGEKAVTASTLSILWKKHFPHVKTPTKGRFATCTTCVRLANRLAGAKSAEERRLVQKEKDKHIALVNAERKTSKDRQKKAMDEPDK